MYLQWRIQDFPRRGAAKVRCGAIAENCYVQTKESGRLGGRAGGALPGSANDFVILKNHYKITKGCADSPYIRCIDRSGFKITIINVKFCQWIFGQI